MGKCTQIHRSILTNKFMKTKIQIAFAALVAGPSLFATSCATASPPVITPATPEIINVWQGSNTDYLVTAAQAQTVTNPLTGQVTLNCDTANLPVIAAAPSPAAVLAPSLATGQQIIDTTITNGAVWSTLPVTVNLTTKPATAAPTIVQ
jgi:hypothetical protein